MFRKNFWVLVLLVILLQTAPFLFMAGRWPPEWVFGGFLLNPIDGNSYLAKMQEGWAGSWQFHLLYTSQESTGAPLFLFYLTLGHLARMFQVPLILMFHAARLICSVILLAGLARVCDLVFPSDGRLSSFALWLASLGSGLGWLVVWFTPEPTADFWIAEAYPFLSMYATPHFAAGMALQVWMLVLDWDHLRRWTIPVLAVSGILLSIIQPFGLVVAGLGLGLGFVLRWRAEKRFNPSNLLWAVIPGGGFLMYQFWAIHHNPLLAAWNQQNLTPAPVLWDFVLSLSPALLLTGFGIYLACKRSGLPLRVLAGWLALGVILVYLPFNLQRRFMCGLYVPVALLAAAGAGEWVKKGKKWVLPVVFAFSLLTNCLLLLSAVGAGGASKDDTNRPAQTTIFLPRALAEGMTWLRANSQPAAVVLAPVEDGLFVPAWSGRRTVYGHPFETVNAEAEKQGVENFYSGKMSVMEQRQYLTQRNVAYVLDWQNQLDHLGKVAFEQDGLRIIEVLP